MILAKTATIIHEALYLEKLNFSAYDSTLGGFRAHVHK